MNKSSCFKNCRPGDVIYYRVNDRFTVAEAYVPHAYKGCPWAVKPGYVAAVCQQSGSHTVILWDDVPNITKIVKNK